MAEITTTATDVQIQNQFDSDIAVSLIARTLLTFNLTLDSAEYLTPVTRTNDLITVGRKGEYWPNEGWS